MKSQEMLDNLTEQATNLQKELLEIERDFNTKKEQFIRIQGAIEALQMVIEEENKSEEPEEIE
jgi:ribosomal protein S15P/S13E